MYCSLMHCLFYFWLKWALKSEKNILIKAEADMFKSYELVMELSLNTSILTIGKRLGVLWGTRERNVWFCVT